MTIEIKVGDYIRLLNVGCTIKVTDEILLGFVGRELKRQFDVGVARFATELEIQEYLIND